MQNILKNFIESWDKSKINMIITGGGISLVDSLKIPGSSKVFGEIFIPYSEESQISILKDLGIENDNSKTERKSAFVNSIKSVSKEMSKILLEWQRNRLFSSENDFFVSVTASLSTIRKDKNTKEISFRKGCNEAYVCIYVPSNKDFQKYCFYHIKINKINEEGMKGLCSTPGMIESLRLIEDETIAKIVLYLISGKEEMKPYWFEEISVIKLTDSI